MSRSFSICLSILLAASPVFANSVKAFEGSQHFAPYSHFEVFSPHASSSWETSSLREHFEHDFDDSEKEQVHFFHHTNRVDCDPRPVPSVDPAVSAVPEVPTSWLLLLGTVTLLGSARLRPIFAGRR